MPVKDIWMSWEAVDYIVHDEKLYQVTKEIGDVEEKIKKGKKWVSHWP